MESPRSDKHLMSFLLCVSLCTCIPSSTKNNVSTTSLKFVLECFMCFTCLSLLLVLTMIWAMFSIWLSLEFFFRILSAMCFGPEMIHFSNDNNKTGRSNPEKLSSNFQFWCFNIWLQIIFAASKIVVKSSKLLYVSVDFAWQLAEYLFR